MKDAAEDAQPPAEDTQPPAAAGADPAGPEPLAEEMGEMKIKEAQEMRADADTADKLGSHEEKSEVAIGQPEAVTSDKSEAVGDQAEAAESQPEAIGSQAEAVGGQAEDADTKPEEAPRGHQPPPSEEKTDGGREMEPMIVTVPPSEFVLGLADLTGLTFFISQWFLSQI